jgi:hypothetical protein
LNHFDIEKYQDKPTLDILIAYYVKTPVAAISIFPVAHTKDINPNIRVTLKPVKSTYQKKAVTPNDPGFLLKGIVASLKPVLRDLKTHREVQAFEISGYHAAFVRISYKMLLIDGSQTRGNSDLWLVMQRADYVLLISGVTLEDHNNAAREELKAIVETIEVNTLLIAKPHPL